MIDMPTVNSIRARRARGDTIAKIARDVGVSEPTVRKYVSKGDFSPQLPLAAPRASILDPYKDAVEAMLDEDSRAWHKQRHTAKRIFERLVEEHGYEGGYGTVQAYVKRRRDERGRPWGSQYLDLVWEPGWAQVDFGQADMLERGVQAREHFLATSFPHSNVGLAQVFHGETSECVCQGLRDVFEFVGRVPRGLLFDNATGVGRRVCETVSTSELFSRFAAHYGFEFRFCGARAGNEKGNVENKVGALRRELFVPVPRVDDLRAYNRRLLGRCLARSEKEHYAKGVPELELFEADLAAMAPLPDAPFECVTYARMTADKKGRVCLESRHRYSADPSLGGRPVIVGKGAFEVSVYTGSGELVAVHERAWGEAPSDSSDPSRQLSLLCVKQNGWPNSRVRAEMPESLRASMDAMGKAERGEALRTLRDVASESGYANAVEAARASVESLGRVDACSVGVMARAAAEGRGPVAYDGDAGLGEYDAAFSKGGAADAQA